MAAGTSAPELIASLVSVFLSSKVETGAGTVIGSVIFNQLVVVGLCIVVSPNGMLVCSPIDMLRDLVFYMISIGVFVWFFWDDQVRGHPSYLPASAFLAMQSHGSIEQCHSCSLPC